MFVMTSSRNMAMIPICKRNDVPSDGLKEFRLKDETRICVANAGGTLYACQAACPHQAVALCEGMLDGTILTCLEHLWQWDLRSGEAHGLAEEPLAVFALEIVGDDVYLKR
jgi:toluene monooxygenase system ferredoxin subunit